MHEAAPGRDKRRRRTARSKLPHIRDIRADLVLTMYARTMTQDEIAEELGIDQGTVSRMIKTALEDRAKQDPEIRAMARALMVERLNLMLARWFPLAIGMHVAGNPDGDDSADSVGPDKDAADMALKILDRIGKLQGVDVAPVVGGPTFLVTPETLRAEIMASLDETAARVRAIDAGTVDVEVVDDPTS